MLTTMLLLQAAVQQPLNLTCFGSGVANKPMIGTARTNTNIYGSVGTTPVSGYGNSTTTITGMRQQGFGDQVDVRLFSGDDRIRLPRTMLPPIHGGDAGWFKLKNVVANERSIKAKAGVNFANSPNVHIDRVTGMISISGKAGDFSGQCEIVDPNAAPRF
jgi:hypothetical protein